MKSKILLVFLCSLSNFCFTFRLQPFEDLVGNHQFQANTKTLDTNYKTGKMFSFKRDTETTKYLQPGLYILSNNLKNEMIKNRLQKLQDIKSTLGVIGR